MCSMYGYCTRGHYMHVPRVAILRMTIPCMAHDKYTRRVCSTPRENVVHADTLWDYLKLYHGATHVKMKL